MGGWAGDPKQPLLIGTGHQVCWHLFPPGSPPPPPPPTPGNPEVSQLLTAWETARTLLFMTPLARGSHPLFCIWLSPPHRQEPIAWYALL